VNVSALNAVCPYYTMYPLEFPLNVLRDMAARVNGSSICSVAGGRQILQRGCWVWLLWVLTATLSRQLRDPAHHSRRADFAMTNVSR
jgi:hypothetical protein